MSQNEVRSVELGVLTCPAINDTNFASNLITAFLYVVPWATTWMGEDGCWY